ncbi:hypothetical protein PR202_ga30796 [Eleusine coracana subsp. coracana]|uniref:Uncharacterized protein n=1 Tax=Eleusine coracana subsp. coracana TaxID=191504 RepID=A0AAV5DPR3_ELECO|nr:hypothetical protein PR202_ga30796 [Eleusine coracana subsp. coracana]
MKPVLDKLGVLMGDEYNKLKGLRKKVSFLEHELRAMNALLEKMDASDEELDPQAKTWRKDIIEMSYDIEDYIDDFMDHVGEARDKEGILKKAYHYLETFMDRCRLANQFEEVKKRVMEASDRTMRYKFDECISNTTSVAFDPRLSALYKESKSLVGISSQKEELVKWVMDEEQPLKVMSIVGFGGLGKTTLANEVYRKVGAQFNCKAFVSVSQKPDMMRLLNSILSQIDKEYKYKDTSHLYETDIIRNIRKCLQDNSWVAAPFRDLERLHLDGWIFSRVPRWLGDLHNLRDMWLWLKQMKGEEIGVIGMLPSLAKLHLGIAGVQTERIVIGGSSSTGFRLVKLFDFNCDKTSLLTFEAGAMPNLVNLRLNLHADGWDKGTPEGLSHLSNLKLIHLWVSADQELRALVRDVFQKAADALPGRPAITESFTISLYRAILMTAYPGFQISTNLGRGPVETAVGRPGILYACNHQTLIDLFSRKQLMLSRVIQQLPCPTSHRGDLIGADLQKLMDPVILSTVPCQKVAAAVS